MFFSWKECQKQINGFSGAEFKSFDNYVVRQTFQMAANTQMNGLNSITLLTELN